MTRSEHTQHADPAVQRRRAMRETKLPAGVEPLHCASGKINGDDVLLLFTTDGLYSVRDGVAHKCPETPARRAPLELYVWLDKDGAPYPKTDGRITAFDSFVTGKNYASAYRADHSPYNCIRLVEVPDVFRSEDERNAVIKRLGGIVPPHRSTDRDYRPLWIALVGVATALALLVTFL